MADFSHYYEPTKTKLNLKQFPATAFAEGYETVLEHGDTLFMPSGYWHHIEYLDSGFAMSLRALNNSALGKLNGIWNLVGMRNIDTLLKKTAPTKWYAWKEKRVIAAAERTLKI